MTESITLTGTVADVFAHRFTLTTEDRTVLADLGPRGADLIALAPGDAVTISGERKPSEIKVSKVQRDRETIDIPHGPKPVGPPQGKPHHGPGTSGKAG